jgi:uncharacterized membrane protein (UPF0127 family)
VSAPSVTPTAGPLPGTEPGAGLFRVPAKTLRRGFLGVAVLLIAFAMYYMGPLSGRMVVDIGNTAFKVRIADEYGEQITGLSTTDQLGPKSGMLFVYDEADYYGIWMKDMKFSIDVVWLGADHTVINIDHNVTPDTYPKVFLPDQPARYILEIPAGAADKAGIQQGQTARFNL